ncbi:dimethyl sulfoxide reductase anchor subunit [Magnetospirillum sp. 15-1]|uniref:dimethyl sulfoxide reductase anchor subunit n=1 Tax=Magnetospirillum sp. 15-1 TaxID=1979370 RepID=UPI000BBC3ED9|nr:dimethyl sulfoxide reductase anchor subunit [Magnetospirillum sp. 15-1]
MSMHSPHRQTSWDWRAAGNFIGGGTGSGLLALGFAAGLPPSLTAVVGGTLIGLGLACVWLEIGRPWRALNVFFHPQTSWMTREGIVAMALYAVGSGAALLSSPGLLGLMALVAMGFVWCQGRILTSAKGIPAWRAGLTLPLILATAAAEGAGAAVLLAGVTGADVPWLGRGLALLLALRYVVWRAYLARLKAPAQAMAAARRLDMPLVLAGHLLPALLAVFGLSLAAGLLAVVAGWFLKYVLITRMAMTQGFALPVTPARGRGTTGTGVKPGWGAAS